MNNKSIQERCNFSTDRLLVNSWTNQVKHFNAEQNFAKKVIEILTPNLTKTLPDGWQNITSLSEAKKWINDRDIESHFLTTQLLSTNETIAYIFLYESDFENENYKLRFGYLLSEKYWGKGLGTELINGLLKWCKEAGDIESISGGVEIGNIASIKILEKSGFAVGSTSEQVIFYEYLF